MCVASWRINYDESVIKRDIPKLDSAVKKRIKSAIDGKLVRDPISFGKPLRYGLSNHRSLRIGDYRVLYIIEHETHTLHIMAIGHRRDIYEE